MKIWQPFKKLDLSNKLFLNYLMLLLFFFIALCTTILGVSFYFLLSHNTQHSTALLEENFPIILLLLSIVFIIFVLIFSKITSKTFVKPLKELLLAIGEMKTGNYSVEFGNSTKIREINQLQESFYTMAQKLKEQTQLKEELEQNRKEMILDLSHDLKNPLTSILGYAQLLMDNENIYKENHKEILNIIYKNGIRANTLVQSLFEYARIENVNYSLDQKKYDICEFLRKLIANHISQIEEKDFCYLFDIPYEKIFIHFDHEKLSQAISNIINNSIKYNPKGTTLSISLKQSSEEIILSIDDDGIGIPDHLSKKIFNPFSRVDHARNSKTGGSGLGLAVCKSIVEKHGGTIHLLPRQTSGTTVEIRLKK